MPSHGYRGIDGELMMHDTVEVAKLLPGTSIRVEVIDPFRHLPTVRDSFMKNTLRHDILLASAN